MSRSADGPVAHTCYGYYSAGMSTPLVQQRLKGRIVEWNDPRGFGWAEGYGQQKVFVHVAELRPKQARPELGTNINYVRGVDSQGRYCAKDVATVATRQGTRRRAGWGRFLWLGILLVLPGLALAKLPAAWWLGPGVVLGLSSIAIAAYAYDKKQAVEGRWRIAESTLHLIEILGGWPGAFLAQGWFRHKCRKATYQATYWSIVLIYQVLAIDVVMSHRPSVWMRDTLLAWMASI
jgi:uncharacterized membrane protein YsdA (DUF1294 family)/cold shock CspA family protein